MRIAVNTRLLLPNKMEGIGWFTFETLKRITQSRPEVEFIFIFDRPWSEQFIFSDNISPVHIGPPSRHPFLWYWWFENSVPRILQRFQPDLFLSPDGYLTLKTHVPSLPVIHDINFEHFPEDLPYWYRKYYRHYFPRYAQKAARIATVSEFSKQDIAQSYNVSTDLIDVVYNGVSDRFRKLTLGEKSSIKDELAEGSPYFIVLGAIHPRKNIARILQAFDKFKNSGANAEKLLFIGRKKWWTKEMQTALDQMKYRKDVFFREDLNSTQVAHAVGGAEALIYTSLFEGFGIPILEAMQCGVPVITSDLSSMPEVANDAALLANPYSVDSIAEQMQRLIRVPGLSEDLILKGSLRTQTFSWDQTAKLLWQSVEKIVKT